MREQTAAMELPRFLWVPFELGRPFGAPHEPDFQRRVLHDALTLLERPDGPVVLADFPDDAPAGDDDVAWSCPVSFAPAPVDETDIAATTRSELGRLAPWAELGNPPPPNSGLDPSGLVDALGRVIDGAAPDVERIRLVADDLRTWYLHAAAQQPGRATSHERNTWFWRDTAAAHLLGHVAATLRASDEAIVRIFAERGIVPRDHWDLLVPGAEEAADD